MANNLDGRVIKGVGGSFSVETQEGVIVCPARGLLKRDDDCILIGDYVELTKDPTWLITKIYPRKNELVRPPVSNIDILVVVLASEPKPDYVLLDKMIIACYNNNIKPIICVNKTDISTAVLEYVERVYGDFIKIYSVSANTGDGIKEFVQSLQGTVCFCGQSAVGKTSLLNVITEQNEETGELSRIMRGRNTTRHVSIHRINSKCELIDTCGFSKLEAGLPDKKEICLYYPDFMKVGECKYRMCQHVREPECAIRAAVKKKKIDLKRYYRYLNILGVRNYDED